MAEVPYQNEPQVEQLLAERATAEAYGQKTLIAAADKVLATFGITTAADRKAAAKHRRAAVEAAEVEKDAPVGRSASKKSTAKQK